jgi:hypothetical protein
MATRSTLIRAIPLLTVFVTGLILAQPVEAHVLKTDGSIGAVLHVDPDDNPIAGKLATFFFEIKDRQRKFQQQDCNCTVTITENGKQLLSQQLDNANLVQPTGTSVDPTLNSPLFTFTFPEKAVYLLVLHGVPTIGGSFQPFTLTYDIRVATQASASTTASPWSDWATILHHALFVIGFAVFIGLVVLDKVRSRKARAAKPASGGSTTRTSK